MSDSLKIDALQLHFRSNFNAVKYDEWRHHIEVRQKLGKKAVDVAALKQSTKPPICWLVEVKDFRSLRGVPKESNLSGLPQEVESKVRDTLEGLADASRDARMGTEREFALRAVRAPRRRIVLHMEPFAGAFSAFAKIPSAAHVQQKLKQSVKDIDASPLVLSIASTSNANVPWTVSSA